MMDELAEDAEEQDDEEEPREEKEAELDRRMQEFEELMERRPFLVNDVLLRRNPDDVQEWEKRVVLYGDNDDKIIETYREAISKINPRKATANFHQMFLNFAQFYEYGGSAGLAKLSGNAAEGEDAAEAAEAGSRIGAQDLRKKPSPFPSDESTIWPKYGVSGPKWSSGTRTTTKAFRIMARSVAPPRNTKGVQYHDETLSPQTRLFKSLKLWSFYVDLEESLGDVESTKRVYEKMLELKIANAQIIINYAAFLEDNKYFEESFKVYERGVELFTYPVAFEIWNVYLSKFVKRYGGAKLERARDLFEQALDKCPARFCKPLMLMYGKLEEDHGLAKRAMKIYDRATRAVSTDDRYDMFVFYLAKAAAKLRSRSYATDLRARDRVVTGSTDGRHVPALCRTRTQAGRGGSSSRHLCACLASSAIHVPTPSSGSSGTSSRSILVPKIRSERCCASSVRCRRSSTRTSRTLPHRLSRLHNAIRHRQAAMASLLGRRSTTAEARSMGTIRWRGWKLLRDQEGRDRRRSLQPVLPQAELAQPTRTAMEAEPRMKKWWEAMIRTTMTFCSGNAVLRISTAHPPHHATGLPCYLPHASKRSQIFLTFRGYGQPSTCLLSLPCASPQRQRCCSSQGERERWRSATVFGVKCESVGNSRRKSKFGRVWLERRQRRQGEAEATIAPVAAVRLPNAKECQS